MSNIRYVVASLPRSGTKYISTVLTKIGLRCGHEQFFGLKRSEVRLTSVSEIFGDASWMSVPYIQSLPPGTIVFHQVRDPIKVLNSNLPSGGDSYFRTWDENAGLSSDPFYKKELPWKRFIWNHTQDWVWPHGGGEVPEGKEEIQRLIHWWINWNLWIEFSSLKRSDLTYVRYRLEDLTSDILYQMVQLISESSSSITIKDCEKAIAEVPSTTNRHRKPNSKITVDMLSPAARLLMYRYGYL